MRLSVVCRDGAVSRSVPAVVLVALSLAGLGGCVATAPPDATGLDADFRLRGKIAVRDSGESFSATFDWLQLPSRFEIELWGAFGQGRTSLRGDHERLTITDSRGHVTSGVRAAELMDEALGWSFPVAALAHWVRGRPAPSVSARKVQRADDGTLTAFEQHGWSIALSRWRQSVVGPVPWRLVATQGDRRILVVCKEWMDG